MPRRLANDEFARNPSQWQDDVCDGPIRSGTAGRIDGDESRRVPAPPNARFLLGEPVVGPVDVTVWIEDRG